MTILKKHVIRMLMNILKKRNVINMLIRTLKQMKCNWNSDEDVEKRKM